jgi:mRNA-degrading endonuclease RelE of RelBE toxin-antitoxin system
LTYNVVYKKSVSHDLKKLSKAEARRILERVERELPHKAGAQPALKGRFAGLRKFRVGEYRVIFALVENDVLVLRIGHRRDVYEKEL